MCCAYTEELKIVNKSCLQILYCSFAVVFLSGALSAQTNPTWNPAWKQSQKVMVQETAGIDRIREPVDIEMQFAELVTKKNFTSIPDFVKRDIRVVWYSPADKSFLEIPSQVYDIKTGKVAAKDSANIAVRARIAFFTDIKAYTTGTYFVYYGNPDAPAPKYQSPLSVKGEGVKYTIDNNHYRIMTEEKSGQIDQIDLKFSSKASFRFKYGTVHWNPDFIVIPDDFPKTGYTWYYAHHFVDPPHEVESGPIFFSIKRSQLIPNQDTAYMEVYYRFYAGLPWFIMTSRIEAKKDCRTFAIRNDELAFGRTDFTHAGWRDKTPDMLDTDNGEIGTTKVWGDDTIRLGGHPLGSSLPANMAWFSLCNIKNGDAVASIRLGWENKNVLTGEPSPLYNSHTVISEHEEGFYWFRSLIYSPRGFATMSQSEIDKNLIPVPKGSSYYEKNAYLLFEFGMEKKFEPVDALNFQLKAPLNVKVIR
jgi:hypothetical protein